MIEKLKPYATPRNIVILVAVIAAIVFLWVFFSRNKEPKYESVGMEILRKQNDSLLTVLQLQAREAQRQAEATAAHKREDSLRFAQYEQRITEDNQIIKNLKNKRDEKITRIDNPSFTSDSIRRAYSGL